MGKGGEFLTIPFAILLSPITVLRHAVSRVLSVRAMLQGKDDKGKGKGKGKDPAQARWETQKARAPFIRNPEVQVLSFWVLDDVCTGYLTARERDLPAEWCTNLCVSRFLLVQWPARA